MSFKELGGFLAWAEDRIAKEYAQHVLMRENCDEGEFLRHFREDRDGLVQDVNSLRSKGYTQANACKEVGISVTSYYQQNKKLKEDAI